MNYSIIKILAVGAFAFIIASCSSKKSMTSSQERSDRPEQSQGNRPQGGGGSQGGGQVGRGGQAPSFSNLLSEMDKNSDGKLSESEIQGPLKNDFSTVDSNDDGFITEEEFENAPRPQRK